MIELTHSVDPPGPMTDRQLVSFHELIQAAARVVEPREALSLVAEKARTLTSATGIAVMLLDPERRSLDVAAVAGMNPSEVVGQRMLVDDALAGHTALTGEIYVADSLDTMKPLLTVFDSTSPFAIGIRTAAVVPIFLGGRSVGALAAVNRLGDGPFTGTELLLLQLLANCAALVLRQDRLSTDALLRERERDILLEAARASSSLLNVQQSLQSVLSTISENLDVSFGAVFLLNDERNRLYISADIGLSDDDRDRQLEADAGFGGSVLGRQGHLLIGDTQSPGVPDDNPLTEARSIIAAPLRARSSPKGLIAIGSRKLDAYTEQDADLLLVVAGQAAIALENAWLYEDATRRANEATAMYELSQAVGGTLNLDEMLGVVAASALRLLQVDKFAAFLIDQRTGRMAIRAARNISTAMERGMAPAVGEGIAGWVAEFATPTAVQDVAADHRNRSLPVDDDVLSLVSVPVQVGERVIGVLQAMSSRRRLFTVEEIELFYTIGNQVASAITNAQLYEDARQKKEEIRKSVLRVARALGSTTHSSKSAQIVADLAVEIMAADRSILWTLDDQGRAVNRAAAGFKSAGPIGKVAAPNSPPALVARRGKTMRLADLQEARCVLPDYMTKGSHGYIGVPLKLGRDTIGVLEVFSRSSREYTADEIRSLITFASQATIGIKNAVLVEQASRQLDDLHALEAISAGIWTIEPLRDLYERVLSLVCEATSSDYGLLDIFVDGDGERVWFRADPLQGDDVAEESGKVDRALSELSDWVRRYGDPAFVPRPNAAVGHATALAVPVRRRAADRPAGVIALSRVAPGLLFDDDDRRLIEMAATMLAARLP